VISDRTFPLSVQGFLHEIHCRYFMITMTLPL